MTKEIYRVRVARAPKVNWAELDPVLLSGEIAFETDTRKVKIGTEENKKWSETAYIITDHLPLNITDIIELKECLDKKANENHEHVIADIENLDHLLLEKANEGHRHDVSEIEGLNELIEEKIKIMIAHL